MKVSSLIGLGVLWLVTWQADLVRSADPDDPKPNVDYATQIKPLIQQHCAACHSADEQEAGLRLDAGKLIVQGGDRGVAVVPGRSEESLLYRALVGNADELPRMPLHDDPLGEEEIALVREWIDAGAPIPEDEPIPPASQSSHWAFQPIVRPAAPEVRQKEFVENPIDAFILRRLEQEGLAPSPPADRETLIRRLSLDLLGLPPAPDDVQRFVNDERPDAYERLVDELLDSPHYGERWGRHWLDLARYADSNGFTIDGARSIWKYRDWVIDAFNRDLPFDQFVIEQLAGDLLHEPTDEQLIATGFHRNTLINEEGGTDREQFRVEAVVDRVNTTGTVFLGLTVGCAQCHTHKFDPITQREYYELFAIFNNSDEPTLSLPTPEQSEQLDALQAELSEAEQQLREYDLQLPEKQAEWERSLAELSDRSESGWTVLDPVEYRSEGGATFTKLDDHSLLAGGDIPPQDTYRVTVDVPSEQITAVRIEALLHDELPGGGPGLTPHGNFWLSEFELYANRRPEEQSPNENETSSDDPPGQENSQDERIKIARAFADYSQENGPIAHAIDGKPETGWGVYAGGEEIRSNREAVFVFEQPIEQSGGSRLTLVLHQNYSGAHYAIGRLRISATSVPASTLDLPEKIREILAVSPDERTEDQQKELATAFRNMDPARKPLADSVAEVKQRQQAMRKEVTTTMILRERGQRRPTHMHIRGDFLRKGAPVDPGVPAVLPPLPSDVELPSRLDFARWLTDPSNPLTARVTVNRFWQRFFGLGLVETENDFGIQGTLPSHPELLDWLASEFMQQGWSMKKLHRTIVTSSTYRQSSHLNPELIERDPRNRLLARQSRLRLEAEIIRDAALSVSGLLSRKIGGPSVYPPQPEGIYVLTQVRKSWPESEGSDRYRRGMYTYLWRSSPYPLLPTFDAPDANTSCTRRPRSNTPLQALTLANDRAFFEIAQGLAVRLLTEECSNDEDRLHYAFVACLSRRPDPVELSRLQRFLEHQRSHFESAGEEAQAAAPPQAPAGISTTEAAAWTAVARVLLNLDEFITRE